MTPQLPPGFELDAPPLPAGFVLDGPAKAPERTVGGYVKAGMQGLVQDTKDAVGGLLRGAGSIGATLMAPQDMLQDAIERQKTGKPSAVSRNGQRRKDITGGTQELLGANPDSMTYGAFKLLPEVAGVAGVGPAIGGLAKATPIAAKIPNVIEAVSTAGMRGGGLVPRAVGGAITGGASAGLVNPEDAGMGAAVGGALPVAIKAGGAVGQAAGRVLRGPEQTAEMQAAIKAARDAGYVIPPSQARPTLGNRLLEGLSGKITTAQNASAKNQAVTNRLAAKAIGVADDAPLTVETLDAVRAEAGKAYGDIATLGAFDATGMQLPKAVKTQAGISPLLMGKTKTVDAAELVSAWKQANHDATSYFRAHGRDANPETLAKAKAAAAAAKEIDKAIEEVVKKAGKPELLDALKAARVRIAKTYSVEGAMNPLTGTIDARKLAKQLEKGKMLSGELLEAASFAGRFPKAAQPIEGMGSLPQTSPLDWAMGGGLAMGTGNPLMLASMAARPAARAAVLSPLVQDRLVQPNAIRALLDPRWEALAYRSAPVLAADR